MWNNDRGTIYLAASEIAKYRERLDHGRLRSHEREALQAIIAAPLADPQPAWLAQHGPIYDAPARTCVTCTYPPLRHTVSERHAASLSQDLGRPALASALAAIQNEDEDAAMAVWGVIEGWAPAAARRLLLRRLAAWDEAQARAAIQAETASTIRRVAEAALAELGHAHLRDWREGADPIVRAAAQIGLSRVLQWVQGDETTLLALATSYVHRHVIACGPIEGMIDIGSHLGDRPAVIDLGR